MSKNTTLTKTCSVCGLEKPLSAFLQVAGPEGTMYGNICSSCRRGQLDKVQAPKEPDESTTSSTGYKIDNKAKQKSDADKLELRKEIDDKYREEREKIKENLAHTTEKTDKIRKSEQKHRDFLQQSRTYISEKKVENKTQPPTKDTAKAAEVHAKEQLDAAKEEAKAKGVDTYAPQVGQQFGMQLKHQGASFRAWLHSIGPSAAMSQAFGLNKEKNNKPTAEKNAADNTEKVDKDAAKDYARDNFPNSRRR